MPRFLSSLLLAATLGTLLVGAEEYTVYFRKGTNTKALVGKLAPLRQAAPQTECRYVVLTTTAESMADAINSANALKAGVEELPCLVISDERGPYATLPLTQLSNTSLVAARAAATAPERNQQANLRHFTAQQYLLMARMKLEPSLQGETLDKCISTCRALMAHPLASPADRQRLGFECLYPLLMRQYTNMYTGAHTPASEAKLLEAIATLEAARDLNRNTTTGKKAFDERERLRKARRQARTME